MKFTRTRARRAAALAGAALTAGLVAVPLAAPASAATASAAGSGTVTVIHGVPGLTVDVYVNGKATLTSFAPDTVTPPIALPAGTYTIDIRKAGAPPSAPPAITGTATLAAGANASLVAHLSASGQPELTAYPNTTSGLAAGKARVIVRHDAAAPAVDVRANGQPVITNLTNPNQKSLDVAAGAVSADVVLAGQSTSVIGPATLTLPAGTTTAVYAVGSAQQGTLHLLTQRVTDAPNAVAAGTGGQAGAGIGPDTVAIALVVGGAVAVATGGWRLARRST
jgi:hypothetical protein